VLWLQELSPKRPSPALYRHPVSAYEVTQGFVDPDDPDGRGLNLEAFMSNRDSWFERVPLGLTPESIQRLREPTIKARFHERYEMVARLGRGAMGDVWHAVDTDLDRPCAVKQLKSELLIYASARRRFQREAKVLARLDHPRVVRVYDIGAGENGSLFMVMDPVTPVGALVAA
jgi:serine/threonine protein kinase